MKDYWPWWTGALALAFIIINYTLASGRSFGVSTAWDRVLHWRAERRVERQNAEFADDRALAEALTAATAQHFGTVPAAAPPFASTPAASASGAAGTAASRPVPVAAQAALLVSVFLGGLAAAITSGRFDIRYDMGDGFRQIVTGDPIIMTVVLFVGGILVGFGTRLAGGCSSGHGLSGCGRLQPASLLATPIFFGTAVVVSFLLWKVI
jgi:uncharacterized membrane protein YedE/YeeE